jgi:hypothetical protein
MRGKQWVRNEASNNGMRTEQRTPLQRDVLRDVMLSAGECDTWLTLDELARMTSYPPASISAQLRHLRKVRHGGYRLDKRCRATLKNLAHVADRGASGPVWEYRMERRRFPTHRHRLGVNSARHFERPQASA